MFNYLNPADCCRESTGQSCGEEKQKDRYDMNGVNTDGGEEMRSCTWRKMSSMVRRSE